MTISKAIMARFANQPLALSPDFDLDAHVAGLAAYAESLKLPLDTAGPLPENFWPEAGSFMAMFRPYNVVDGVLRVPVKGTLANDLPFSVGSLATGYEYIRAAVARGVADEDVHTIALLVNSPGGMVTGCFEAADAIFEARSSKRIVAMVDDHAYSAAYALASSAHEIVVTRTGGVGSIGVLTYHIDASGAYEMAGIVKTYLHAGKFKVDGNETEPLSKSARSRIERRLAASYDVFVGTVARNRAMSDEDVRATEALTYTALDGIEVGLADRIGTYDGAISAYSEAITHQEDEDMADKQATFTQDQLDAAVAAARVEEQAAVAAAVATATAEGATAERARITAILGSDAAKERPTAARQVAFSTDFDADKASTFLAALPAETVAAPEVIEGAAAPKGMFDAAMEKDGSTGLSATIGDTDADADLIEGTFHLLGRG